MKYVNANDTEHTIKLILRQSNENADAITLYNEFTQTTDVLDSTFIVQDGIYNYTFEYEFKDGDSFQFKIEYENVVYYRGKIKAIL